MLLRALSWLTLFSVPLPALDIGDILPPLQGQFLSGRDARLPATSYGKPALLALGFTYKSRFAVEAWTKRFRSEFGSDSRVTFFEVPMIGGMGFLGKWFIESGMRRGTPKADQEHVITVYSGVGEWKKRCNLKDPDAACLLLIDKEGKVAWTHTGAFEEAPFATLASRVRSLFN